MKRALPFLLLLSLTSPVFPGEWEPPNFSLLGNLGGNFSTGYIPSYQPGVSGGLWLGVSLSDRSDGFWALDYHSLPGLPVTLFKPSPSNPQTVVYLRPTDDLFFSVNIRWYLDQKWDRVRARFKEVPYLVGGMGLCFLVDQYDRPPGLSFYNASYDLLFGLDLGGGMDFPLGDGKQWILYAEGLDHIIFWQGLTQVLTARVGIKVMLDSEHLDPFR